MAAVTVAELLIEIGVDAKDAEKASSAFEKRIRQLEEELKRLRKRSDESDKSLKKWAATTKKVADNIGSLFKKVALAGTALGGAVLKVGSDFETLEARLKTATGSAAGAAEAMGFVTDFAQKVPFQVQEITDSFIKLEGAGLKPTEERLRAFSDIAAGNAKSLNQFTEAVLDASQGEFERLKEFNIRGAKEGEQVALTFKGVTTRVENSSEAITQFLQTLGQENFTGASAERMNTLSGVISNAKDQFALFLNEVAKDGPIEAFKELIDALVKNVGGPNGLAQKISKALTGAIKTMTRAVEGGALTVLGKLVDVLLLLIENWDVLMGIFAGAKTAQAFAAVATGFTQMGFAATAALGPIGAVAAALVAIIPLAMKAGDAIGDALTDDATVNRKRRGAPNISQMTSGQRSEFDKLGNQALSKQAELEKWMSQGVDRNSPRAKKLLTEIATLETKQNAIQDKAAADFRGRQSEAAQADAMSQFNELANADLLDVGMGPEFVPDAFKSKKGGGGNKRRKITSPVTITEFFNAAAHGDLGAMASKTPRAEAIEPTVAITINNTTNNFDIDMKIKGSANASEMAVKVASEFERRYQSKLSQAGQKMGPPTVLR